MTWGHEMPDLFSPPCVALRCMLGLIFLRGGWDKARAPRETREAVAGYRLLPERLAAPAALLLTASDGLLGLLLLSGLARGAAAGLAMLLLGLFCAAMAAALLRGRHGIACGCLPGSADGGLSWDKLALTACLVPIAGLSALGRPPASVVLGAQEMLAGLLLFVLHDSLLRLGVSRVARVRR